MWHRVDLCSTNISEPSVNSPNMNTARYLLVLYRVTSVGVEITTPLITLPNRSILVDFIIYLGMYGKYHTY